MTTLRCCWLLAVQFWAHAASSHSGTDPAEPSTRPPTGLSCVNDFVNNVSCSWVGAPLQPAPGADCWIFGVKKTWVLRNMLRRTEPIIRSCKLRRRRSFPPGCSFVFEGKEFNPFEVMPNISMECDGALIHSLARYRPVEHIRMNPPGRPRVNKTANYTWISWSLGSLLSRHIESFDFQVQVAVKNQTWEDAHVSFGQEQVMKMLSSRAKGSCRVRVRVRSANHPNSSWSSWSPTTSWMGPTDVVQTQDHDWLWVKRGLMLGLALVVMTLVLYGSCMISGWRLKGKTVPTPSDYFHTLQSVHKGNLKKWLNPLSASESFFTTQGPDHISPVEVCESWDVDPCASPCSSSSSSTGALLRFHGDASANSDTSGTAGDLSSSSSSYFYNLGYFVSASSGGSARGDPIPARFTYGDGCHGVEHGPDLHVSLCSSFAAPTAYEALKREPRSPDSGLGLEQEDEDDRTDETDVDVGGGEVSVDPHRPPAPSPPAGLNQNQVDVAMSRSCSMNVEPCKTGYLTLKELQSTFSNKSI